MALKYPKFHSYVNHSYIVIAFILCTAFPIIYIIKHKRSVLFYMIITLVVLILSYAIYWAFVRLKFHSKPQRTRQSIQSTQQNDLTSIRSTETSNEPIQSTSTNYQLANLTERSDIFISSPPPTYRNDLPPPYSAE
ncbi:13172_t:CDS:2, partial [Dentiscutata erythropus]